jgi:CRISPR-associated protein Cmr6
MRYPLPEDTAAILTTRFSQNRNLGLALDRFLPINDKLDTEGNPWNKPEDQWKITDEAKKRQRAPIGFGVPIPTFSSNRGATVHAIPSAPIGFDVPIPTLVKMVNTRRAAMFKSLSGYTVLTFNASPDYRLVVGFGAEHVLETSLCLHRIYGFPIIPGSAVKGVTRAWEFWELAEQLQLPEADVPQLERLLTEGRDNAQREMWGKLKPNYNFADWQAMSCDFYKIFGTTERQGQVIFFDAYPSQARTLKLDILNPHYGDYYQKKKDRQGNPIPPADYLSPVPTYFLTVAEGSSFQFAVASKDSDLAAKAKGWLTCALTELGIGGKTAAGYGVFQRVEDLA